MNRRAFVLGAAMVLLGNLVAVALRSYAEAAFLAEYGAKQLPWLFIASAGGFAAATFAYDALTRRGHAGVVDVALLAVLGVAAAVAPALLAAGVSPAVLVVTLVAVSQVAGLALWNRVAASVAGRDARRMLPRAGAAVTAGGAIAGLGAAALIPRFGMSVIPYAGAAVTAAVLALTVAQERALATGGAPGTAIPAGSSQGLGDVHWHLLRALIAVAALEAMVGTVVDLQFATALKARYTDDTLGIALALFYGGTNAILLLLQATAVPHLLVTRSVPTTAAIHPVIVIAWYLGFAAAPSFVGVAGTRTSDQVLRLATSRTSQEIELSPLPPAPRGRWKVLLRGGIGPSGAAIAALALLLVGPVAPATLAGVAIAIALVWLVASRIAARRFQAALAAPLGIRAQRRDDPRRIDLETLEQWTAVAGGDDAREAALARAALARARVDPADLADHLRHDEPAVRASLFEQLARSPSPSLRGELRAAIEIEDDDRALALGIKALAIAGDGSGVERGKGRADLSREVAHAVRSADRMLRGGDVFGEIRMLCERDPQWAAAFVRARRVAGDLPDDMLAQTLKTAANADDARGGALAVIACVGPDAALPALTDALEAGAPEALAAIAQIDADGAAYLASRTEAMAPPARIAVARSLAGAPAGVAIAALLIADRDPEVAHAALRSALAIARGGELVAATAIASANDAALAALVAHLDARDAAGAWSACARGELEIATRRCVARVMWASALDAAAAGRDPAPLAATARHLTGHRDADRKRALDVVQELQTGRGQILAVFERWLRPPVPAERDAAAEIAAFDPWLASLATGELAAREPTLVELRRPALFASVAGPALAALAEHASRRAVDGELFRSGDPGDTMFVVAKGSLIARRPPGDDRKIDAGGVIGELAVLTRAPRAATVLAPEGAEVLAIDRATFTAASRRAPELVLGLSSTLAGWLAPNRPDVL
jgi:Cyclic nucleotide-binding domain